FSTIMNTLLKYMTISNSGKQMTLMNAAFSEYIEKNGKEDFEFDKGNVSKWFSGEDRQSPSLVEFYGSVENMEALIFDVQYTVFPLLYDKDKAVQELYSLLMNDSSLSESKKADISRGYPYESEEDKAAFVSRIIFLGLQQNKLLYNPKTGQAIDYNEKLQNLEDYLCNNVIPKPQRYFCGRETDLQNIHSMLDSEGKIFIQGIAGIGKSEFVKMYAKKYRKSYTGIIYFTYNGDLKKMIIERSFVADKETENEDTLFKRHNGFFKSLKKDVMIIIDNFDTVPAEEKFLDEMIESYGCKILFTTRSNFDEDFYTSYTLKELPQTDLYNIVFKIYGKAENHKDTIMQIINEVHSHSLCVELAARLMGKGRIPPEELLNQLRADYGVMKSQRLVSLKKDGKMFAETYYGHIHKLISLVTLSDKGKYIMQNMSIIPHEGIEHTLFCRWLLPVGVVDDKEYKALLNNEIDNLTDLGFIQTDGYDKISLHPLVQQVALDDIKPGIVSCHEMVENLKTLFLIRNVDYSDRTFLFRMIGNITEYIEKNDVLLYVDFLNESFEYAEKYKMGFYMEIILSELELYIQNIEPKENNFNSVQYYERKAYFFSNKSTFELLCRKDTETALKYSLKAANLCGKFIDLNPLLVASIYSDLAEVYRNQNRFDEAYKYLKLAGKIISDKKLPFGYDVFAIERKCANLLESMGKYFEAFLFINTILVQIKDCKDNPLDLANILYCGTAVLFF
ncbi:MAG: tetratricopeptide repeat protein, partial [Clostridiales bacterium]|nr:tetratricopeptide repeat protein [Clostridiales bacterium]